MTNILLMGNGWGTVAALKALQKSFNTISIHSDDSDVLALLRETDKLIKEEPTFSTFNLIICAGYKKILQKSELKQSDFINIHYSNLPKYRGLHSVVWAILNHETETAVSIHKILPDIDSGDIIAQYPLSLDNLDAQQAMEALNKLVEQNLNQTITQYLNGQITPQPQDHTQATWVNKRNLKDCKLDFSMSIHDLNAFFHALVPPYPQPFFSINNQEYTVIEHELIKRPYICTIGAVVNIDTTGAFIKCKDGLVLIKQLQDQNGQTLAPHSVLKTGQRL